MCLILIPWFFFFPLDRYFKFGWTPQLPVFFIFISTALKERKISSLRIWIYILLCFVFLSHDSYILLLHHLEFIFHYGMRYVFFVSNVCPLFFQSSFFKMILEITLSYLELFNGIHFVLSWTQVGLFSRLRVLFLWSIFFPFSFLLFFLKIIENDFWPPSPVCLS